MRNKWLNVGWKELWEHGGKIFNLICVAENQRGFPGEGFEPIFDVG